MWNTFYFASIELLETLYLKNNVKPKNFGQMQRTIEHCTLIWKLHIELIMPAPNPCQHCKNWIKKLYHNFFIKACKYIPTVNNVSKYLLMTFCQYFSTCISTIVIMYYIFFLLYEYIIFVLYEWQLKERNNLVHLFPLTSCVT